MGVGRDTDTQSHQRQRGIEAGAEADSQRERGMEGDGYSHRSRRNDMVQCEQGDVGAGTLRREGQQDISQNSRDRLIPPSGGQWHSMVAGADSGISGLYLAGQGMVKQYNDNREGIEHDDDEDAQRERVDATGAWLDSTMSEVDAVCGDIDAFIQAERREAEKRESAIIRTVARAREAGKRLMQRYERVRKEITRAIVQVRQRQAEKKKEQEIIMRQQQEQKQAKSKSRDRGMDFDMGM